METPHPLGNFVAKEGNYVIPAEAEIQVAEFVEGHNSPDARLRGHDELGNSLPRKRESRGFG